MRRALLAILVVSAVQGQSQAPEAPAPANLLQLMRGTFYPSSNVVFWAQDENPDAFPHAKDPNMATDLLGSSFGKWQAVENSALAIAELATLLNVPGRKCSNGMDVPVKNADWAKFVQELRDAGMMAYAAAQSKNQDRMIDAAGVMTTACAHCHIRYREKKLSDRCK
jgi:hypothetical protein